MPRLYNWYIENCEDAPLFVSALENVYTIPSKKRVLIISENAEKEKLQLGDIDLYDIWDRENKQIEI